MIDTKQILQSLQLRILVTIVIIFIILNISVLSFEFLGTYKNMVFTSSILIEKVAAVVAFHGIIFLNGRNSRT